MNQQNISAPDHTAPRRRRGFLAGLALGVLGAGLLGFAIGATMPAAEAALGVMARGGFGHDGPPSPEEAKEKAGFVVGFALHRLDASAEQEAGVQKIVDGAIDEVFPLVGEHHSNRDRLRAILAAPVIDRAEVEKLRTEEMALLEDLSRVVVKALADSAEVLTVEQRTELVRRLERFHHHH